jgi:hypothetical protein
MAPDPTTGSLFLAWMDGGVAERDEILSRRWDTSQEVWAPALDAPAENLSQSKWQDSGPAVFFDRWGHGLILWTRRYAAFQGAPADGTDVLWRSWQGAGWSDEQVLFHINAYLPSSYGYGLVPVETADGITWFITWDNQVRIARYQDQAWTALTDWELLTVSLAAAIVDPDGLIHLAAFGENSRQSDPDWWFNDAYYLTYDGANWTVPINLSYTDGVANAVSLAFDAQGRLHFFWSDPDYRDSSESLKSAIYERVYEGGNWTPNAEVTDYNLAQAINGFVLIPDQHGLLHLAWSEGLYDNGTHTGLDIYYQTGDGTDWGPEEQVYTSPVDSRYVVLAVAGSHAFVAWEEFTPERDILLARRIGMPQVWVYLPLVGK